jgi:hypothetical protein
VLVITLTVEGECLSKVRVGVSAEVGLATNTPVGIRVAGAHVHAGRGGRWLRGVVPSEFGLRRVSCGRERARLVSEVERGEQRTRDRRIGDHGESFRARGCAAIAASSGLRNTAALQGERVTASDQKLSAIERTAAIHASASASVLK